MKPILFVLICFLNISLALSNGAANSFAENRIEVNILTEHGAIKVVLYPDKAPITVANFIKYVDEGFYKSGTFFRTVRSDNQPDSPVKITVIQAVGISDSIKARFDPIPLERTNKTGILHKDGTISMARSTPDTAQDSFFICIDDQPELDFGGKRNPDGQGFAAFGQVIEGMDVVRKINESPAKGQGLTPPVLILDLDIIH